ncbi:DUF6519 domain-containing protein [Leptolyngbya sp. FACHB-261]|uniref:DUF6519 domain-containing protein n=1 Tax=Leptolyngbya sp. FACHB-261 TaxID=2692806 RepID=UPI0016856811|nr:DUF6519 domain-containing protein [Leptolyngbya sp. FACHB-261]MBD2099868.1 tail fiber domain-containing protein [Leptolyngbya sp. FACHB-261]
MKGDFTRSTFRSKKRYSSVRMQQGRLQLDADWNEQVDIQSDLLQTQVKDTIGLSSVSRAAGDGFKISLLSEQNDLDLKISPGRIYVDGILCELSEEITYQNQPDHPNALKSDLQDSGLTSLTKGSAYLAYLDVWQRHITALEDPTIREVALNGLDTTTRTKTIAQIKLLALKPLSSNIAPGTETTDQDPAARSKRKAKIKAHWQELIQAPALSNAINGSKASLTVRTESNAAQKGASSSGGGYRLSENQLYRVEIHSSGGVETAKFKWSRDNGTIISAIEEIKGNTITVRSPGRDASQFFAPGQWVEVLDEERELNRQVGTLVRLTGATSGTKLVFDPASVVGDAISAENFRPERKAKVRRWDHQGSDAAIATNKADWIALEAGIEVKFEVNPKQKNPFYRAGDYWLIPARATTSDIEWPRDSLGLPEAQPPQGSDHFYCPLALLHYGENGFSLSQEDDYRDSFPPLVRCLDKSGDTMTGVLELQADLHVTGQYIDDKYQAGKVGIGTTKPQQALIIAEAGKIGIGYNDPNQTAALAVKDNVGLGTHAPAQKLVIADGKVGIGFNEANQTAGLAVKENLGVGTPTPAQKLVVTGGKVGIGFNEANQTAALAIKDNVGIGIATPAQKLVIANGKVGIGFNDPNQSAALAVSGNLGIGTVTPAQKLVVSNGKASIGYNDSTQTGALAINGNVGIGTVNPNQKLVVTEGQVSIGFNEANQTGALAVNGNVGIGVATPAQKLVVNDGQVGIGFNDANQTATLAINGSVGIGVVAPAQKLVISQGKVSVGYNDANQTAALAIDGNLGIGTTTPNQKLVVDGNHKVGIGFNEANQTATLAINGNVGIGVVNPNQKLVVSEGQVSIGFNEASQTGALAIKGNVGIGITTPAQRLVVKDGQVGIGFNEANQTAALAVNGNVGIGTHLPQQKLVIDQGQVGIGYNDTNQTAALAVNGNTGIGTHTPRQKLVVDQGQVGIGYNDANQTASLAINGRLGIGTVTPAEQLHLASKGSAKILLEADTDNKGEDGHSQLIFRQRGGQVSGFVGFDGKTNELQIANTWANRAANITFATQSKMRMSINGEGVVQINGNVLHDGTSWQVSSREVKDEIIELPSQEAAEILDNLNPVKFVYKADPDKNTRIGFISEEVPTQVAAPSKKAISSLDIVATVTRSVKDHQQMMVLLIKAMEEQQRKMAALETKLEAFERQTKKQLWFR